MEKEVRMIFLISLLIFSLLVATNFTIAKDATANTDEASDELTEDAPEDIAGLAKGFKEELKNIKDEDVRTPLPSSMQPLMSTLMGSSDELITLEQFVVYVTLVSILFYTLLLILSIVPFLEKVWQHCVVAIVMTLISLRSGVIKVVYTYIISASDIFILFASKRFWIIIAFLITGIICLRLFKKIIKKEKHKDKILEARIEGEKRKALNKIDDKEFEFQKDLSEI